MFWCDFRQRWCSTWNCGRQRCERADNINKEKEKLLQEVKEDICDNYCQYRDTADDDFLCDAIRDGDKCPLDRLDELGKMPCTVGDKVIKRLEELKNPLYREDGSLMAQKLFIRIDKAIEIVRQFMN